jgi:hypothetical protein
MLPNLMSNIQYVFMVCSVGRSLASLRSTRTRRNHIQCSLELLQLCDADGVWSHITICQNRMFAWPKDANVSSLPGALDVHEVDKNGDSFLRQLHRRHPSLIMSSFWQPGRPGGIA